MKFSKCRALTTWFMDAKYFWFAIGTNTIALLFALWPGSSEQRMRIMGLALQVFGISTIIWGIIETRVFFGHIPIFAKAKAWLSRCPLRNRVVALSAHGITSGPPFIGKARLYEMLSPGGTPSTESRLIAVEKNQLIIHQRITDALNELDTEMQNIAVALKKEKNQRYSEDASLYHKLEATGTGGIHISAIGASWLFVGVILSTASIEIHKWMQ